jgi:hypothetical protein
MRRSRTLWIGGEHYLIVDDRVNGAVHGVVQ